MGLVPVIESHRTVMKGALIVAILLSVAAALPQPDANADPWVTYSAYGGNGGYGLYTGYGGYGLWGKKKRSAEPEPEPWVRYGGYGHGYGGYGLGYGGLYGGYGHRAYGLGY